MNPRQKLEETFGVKIPKDVKYVIMNEIDDSIRLFNDFANFVHQLFESLNSTLFDERYETRPLVIFNLSKETAVELRPIDAEFLLDNTIVDSVKPNQKEYLN